MRITIIAILSLFSTALFGQVEDTSFVVFPGIPEVCDDTSAVFMIVDEMPLWKGCEKNVYKPRDQSCTREKMNNFLNENIVYPEEALLDSVQGKVFVSFVVDVDGFTKDVKVLLNPIEGLSQEAVRVVSLFPQFTPGKQRGEKVPVTYNLKVDFKLE